MGIKIQDAIVVNLESHHMLPVGNVGNNEANATTGEKIRDYIENDFKTREVFAERWYTDEKFNDLYWRADDLGNRVNNLENGSGNEEEDDDVYIVDLETADSELIKDLTGRLFGENNKPKPSGNLITYGGKPITGWYKKNDGRVAFTYNGTVPYTTEENKLNSDINFEVVVGEGVVYKNFTEQKYPNIPEQEIWYTTNDGNSMGSYPEEIMEHWYDEENQCFRLKIINEDNFGRTPDSLFSHVENITGVYFSKHGWELRGICADCPNLKEVQLPNYQDGNVYGINFNCFENCTSLRTIYFPAKVGYIDWDSNAFNGCTNLTTMIFESYSAPHSTSEKITTIGENFKNDGTNIFYYPEENDGNYMYNFYKNLQNLDTNGFRSSTFTDLTAIPINEYSVEYVQAENPTIVPNTNEEWVFTLEDGTEVTKRIFLGV